MNLNDNNNHCNNINKNKLKIKKNSENTENQTSFEILSNKSSNDNVVKEEIDKIEYNDDELNLLPYKLAKLYDKRNYWEYYISLLKIKHILIFSFFNNDYNSKLIKIDLFFISFITYYTINALFFNDDTMHKIYENKGSFDFIYQLPKIIYSTLISIVLNTIFKLLALSNDGVLELKHEKSKNKNIKIKDLFKKLRIKFILYFIISFILLLLFWYYLSMFGAIYRNTQIQLIDDTLISFGLSLIYPFLIYLLPGIFRIPSLKREKGNGKYLYNFSKLLQMI